MRGFGLRCVSLLAVFAALWGSGLGVSQAHAEESSSLKKIGYSGGLFGWSKDHKACVRRLGPCTPGPRKALWLAQQPPPDADPNGPYRRDGDPRGPQGDQGPPPQGQFQQAPPPMHPDNFRLIAAGWGTFGGAYFLTMATGLIFIGARNFDPYVLMMFVPVIGPFIGLGFAVDGVGKVTDSLAKVGASVAAFFYGFFGILSSLAQIAGLTMAIVGHVRHNMHSQGRLSSSQPSWQILPYARGDEAGLVAFGRF
ncbi:MAG: hypothetical protein H6727_07585 [Myxococcales bacterium]|nr:hypothetical protein [Myxococcales bacterium]